MEEVFKLPVIKTYVDRLESLVEGVSEKELIDSLYTLKCDVSWAGEGILEIELYSDRPDMLISEGIARAVKGVLGIEKGLKEIPLFNSNYKLVIENVSSRPYIGLSIIEGYELDEKTLEELIQFQEKLHTTIGRGRRKVAIGLHDLGKVPSREIVYREVDVRKERMKPLGCSGEWRVIDVLEKTEQGRKYGSISLTSGFKHPAIYAGDEIISLPPVINSEVTRLEPGTKGLLIDVTGTDRSAVMKTLDILSSILAERRGCRVGRVLIESGGFTPEFRRDRMKLEVEYASRELGFKIESTLAVEMLRRMRFNAEVLDENVVDVTIPEYRVDILHPIDLVEDIAIAYGYPRINPIKPTVMMRAREDPLSILEELASSIASSMSFTETLTYTLVPESLAEEFIMQRENLVVIENPISLEMNVVRPSIIPSLLLTLRDSQGVELPLKIFEVGYTAKIVGEVVESRLSIGLAVMDDSVSFEDIQAPAYALIESLGLEASSKRMECKSLIRGRAAVIEASGYRVGVAGEIHPRILEELGIKYPVAVAELYLDKLLEILESRV